MSRHRLKPRYPAAMAGYRTEQRSSAKENPVKTIEQSIEVDVPVRTAYNQWTQFEEFPSFMAGVETVKQIDDAHVHWKAKIGGIAREWDAVITEQTPDQRVAWNATDGTGNAGVVTFHRLDENKTRVMVQMTIEGEDLVEKIGEKSGVIESQVEADLDRFKELIESRGTETGGWRGQVTQDPTS
jgi:uncharacterized membrane protein